jgi:hypothetical protein
MFETRDEGRSMTTGGMDSEDLFYSVYVAGQKRREEAEGLAFQRSLLGLAGHQPGPGEGLGA